MYIDLNFNYVKRKPQSEWEIVVGTDSKKKQQANIAVSC